MPGVIFITEIHLHIHCVVRQHSLRSWREGNGGWWRARVFSECGVWVCWNKEVQIYIYIWRNLEFGFWGWKLLSDPDASQESLIELLGTKRSFYESRLWRRKTSQWLTEEAVRLIFHLVHQKRRDPERTLANHKPNRDASTSTWLLRHYSNHLKNLPISPKARHIWGSHLDWREKWQLWEFSLLAQNYWKPEGKTDSWSLLLKAFEAARPNKMVWNNVTNIL